VERLRDWWRSAIIYQVYPRSFADGNGDGTGDLPGITTRLPYLRDLGVDAVWLSPFYRSPMADGGYDVADYRDVDPIFGTLADFDRMLAEAHRLGLRVIVDIVPNHSSSAHPWFREALAAPAGSPARDRYIFRAGRGPDGAEPPNNWQSIFTGPAWTRVDDGSWYLHLFDSSQPDLNWRNPQVHQEFRSILEFWLDRGVDGFRVDVAHGLIKAVGLPDLGPDTDPDVHRPDRDVVPYFDQDEVHEVYRDWRKLLDSYPGDRMAVAEVWAATPERLARYIRGDELHQAFNFDLLDARWSAGTFRSVIETSLTAAGMVDAPSTWVLSNHDRQRHPTRYGGGGVGTARARAAILLTLALPGAVYVYQGEELGLTEVLDLPPDVRQDPAWVRSGGAVTGRDGCRVPLPWSGDAPPFGFGPPGTTPWLPQPASWATMTAQAQADDPRSMLSLYRRALRLRRTHPALGPNAPDARTLTWLDAPDGTLYFRREPGFVCAINMGGRPVTLPRHGEALLVSGAPPVISGDTVTLAPDTAAWWSTNTP
jgi:alpha-glucosidase